MSVFGQLPGHNPYGNTPFDLCKIEVFAQVKDDGPISVHIENVDLEDYTGWRVRFDFEMIAWGDCVCPKAGEEHPYWEWNVHDAPNFPPCQAGIILGGFRWLFYLWTQHPCTTEGECHGGWGPKTVSQSIHVRLDGPLLGEPCDYLAWLMPRFQAKLREQAESQLIPGIPGNELLRCNVPGSEEQDRTDIPESDSTDPDRWCKCRIKSVTTVKGGPVTGRGGGRGSFMTTTFDQECVRVDHSGNPPHNGATPKVFRADIKNDPMQEEISTSGGDDGEASGVGKGCTSAGGTCSLPCPDIVVRWIQWDLLPPR